MVDGVTSVFFREVVIDEYANGKYRLIKSYLNSEVNYEDGTSTNVFFSENLRSQPLGWK